MKRCLLGIFTCIFSLHASGQTCTIISKANNITPDKLCSPVTAIWTVSYTGVNNAGTPVQIRFDWDNGSVETVNATQTGNGVFQANMLASGTPLGEVLGAPVGDLSMPMWGHVDGPTTACADRS